MTRTNYISEFHLFVLVRPTNAPDGTSGYEPQLIHGDEACGLAVYCSALDAEIVRAQRIAQGESGWRRLPLQDFPATALACAGTGQLVCQMVYGFMLSGTKRLIVVEGRLQPVYYPIKFDGLAEAGEPVTFDFVGNGRIFDGMRHDWARIGAHGHPQQIAKVNQEPGLRLANLADRALRAASPTIDRDAKAWGVYRPYSSAWTSGSTDPLWDQPIVCAEPVQGAP